MTDLPTRVLFVCLGNICRSPTAEAVFRHKAVTAGWGALLEADSASTAAWHVGKAPDSRTIRHAALRGYDLASLRARQVTWQDFGDFDHIFAMDDDNFDALCRLEAEARQRLDQPPRARVARLLDHYPDRRDRNVPDPYHGGDRGFETVLDLIEASTDGLLRQLLKQRGVFGCGC